MSATAPYLWCSARPLSDSFDSAAVTRFDVTERRNQTEALVDVTKKFMLRGGYRYEWGHSTVNAGVTNFASPYETGELKRYVGLVGFQFRPTQMARRLLVRRSCSKFSIRQVVRRITSP